MKNFLNLREHLSTFRQILLWSALVLPVGIFTGSASALFLWLLDVATVMFRGNGGLLFLLPVAGIFIAALYHLVGKSSARGNNLIIEEIHSPGGGVPARMAPLVLFATLLTHLFGGSAGREGTAVQMGGSLADTYRRLLRLDEKHRRILLMAGIAAGFGSVFGTPVAGAIFAMEVLIIGRIQYDALIPVLVASIVGDLTCSAWGIHHTAYHIGITDQPKIDLVMLGWVATSAICFGMVSRLFSTLTHELQEFWTKSISIYWLRPVAGAAVIILLVHLLGTRDYLGLGVSNPDPNCVTILSAFHSGGADAWSWWWKILFTAVTLSCGFKGGEVTPLFFIGATLGNTIATLTGNPVDLFAGLGFIAVFAGAANTPLACTLMGIELFGSHHAAYFATACFISYCFSGRAGIYRSQKPGIAKY